MQTLNKEDMWLFINSHNVVIDKNNLEVFDISSSDVENLKYICEMYALKNRRLDINIVENDSDVIISVVSDTGETVTNKRKIPDNPMIRLLYKLAKLSVYVRFYENGMKLCFSDDAYLALGDFFRNFIMIHHMNISDEQMRKALYNEALNKLFEYSIFEDTYENRKLCFILGCE